MRKYVLLGALIVMSSGCASCWRPFRGALCNTGCRTALPALPTCNDCNSGYSAGYSGIDGEIIGGSGYYGSGVEGYYGGEVIQNPASSPSMVPPAT